MNKAYDNFLKQTIKANKELGKYINQQLTNKDYEDYGMIGEGGDEAKNIDVVAETIFVKYLTRFCDIVSEESGVIKSTKPVFKNGLIIMDPLDGSDNFLSNFPYFGTSVSLQIDTITVVGIVYNLVTNKYVFKTPTKTNILNQSHLKSNFGIFERAYREPKMAHALSENNIKFRSPGATAISLSNARDYLFVLVAGEPRKFDIDAGIFISNDLYIYQNNNFLLVSKDENYFSIIKDIIKGY
jgi:myo-inositol-1(or 4)-monophosphatase